MMGHSFVPKGLGSYVFSSQVVGWWLLACAAMSGCSGEASSDPAPPTSGNAGSGGKPNGAGGEIILQGGATNGGAAAGGRSGSGGASASGVAGAAGSMSGGASAGGGAGGASNGGSTAMGGSGGASTAGSIGLSAVSAAYCSSARTCCPTGSPLTDCESRAAMHHPTASIQSGAVRVDTTALAACVAAYQKAASGCQEIPAVAACNKVFIGTRKPGESCGDSGYECSIEQGASTCLVTAQAGHTGVCKMNSRGHAGDACLYSCRDGDSCAGTTYGAADTVLTLCFESDGLFCDYGDSGATCKPIKKTGDQCITTDECGTKGYCDTTCKRISMEGESCGSCRHDLTCTNGTCQSPTFEQANACDGYSLGP